MKTNTHASSRHLNGKMGTQSGVYPEFPCGWGYKLVLPSVAAVLLVPHINRFALGAQEA